jgi:hypothetical protein
MAERAHLSSGRQRASARPDKAENKAARAWLIASLAVLCCLATAAGMGAAILLDKVAPVLRMPAARSAATHFQR